MSDLDFVQLLLARRASFVVGLRASPNLKDRGAHLRSGIDLPRVAWAGNAIEIGHVGAGAIAARKKSEVGTGRPWCDIVWFSLLPTLDARVDRT